MKILSIDTSCDDTAAAVTVGNKVLSNIVWSQACLHAKWGGVVPSLAKRAHAERLPLVVSRALRRSNLINAIAVTVGPGLAPALEAGIHYAKALSLLHEIPLIPVNHLEGHLVSAFALPNSKSKIPNPKQNIIFPALGLIISGGHTQLVEIKKIPNTEYRIPNGERQMDNSVFSIQNSVFEYRLLADTLDDALGEALDKAARLLGLGYPGGAVLEKFARDGNPQKYKLPLPLLGRENQAAFSFSGLKSAFYRLAENKQLFKQEICDLAAGFQSTAFDHLIRIISKTLTGYKIYKNYNFYDFLIGGGVAANAQLRRRLRKLAKEFNLKIHFPYSKKLCTDNAAMIGVAAQYAYNRGEAANTEAEINAIDRVPNLNFSPPRRCQAGLTIL